jgi:hypothetical protein
VKATLGASAVTNLSKSERTSGLDLDKGAGECRLLGENRKTIGRRIKNQNGRTFPERGIQYA